jgi:cell volume regulation protein A
MAVFLTVGMITLISVPGFGIGSLAFMFVQQMALGGALGYAMGKFMVQVVNRLDLEYEGLYPAVTWLWCF